MVPTFQVARIRHGDLSHLVRQQSAEFGQTSLEQPATAGRVRPSRALVLGQRQSLAVPQHQGLAIGFGQTGEGSTKRTIASFRSARSDGEDCSAASHASSRAEEVSIAASSDRSRMVPLGTPQ